MGDMAEAFHEMRKYKKSVRNKQFKENMKYLVDNKIDYQKFNGGLHLKIKGCDFWPSTNKWNIKGRYGYGLKKLIKEIERLDG